ncbi:MAG: helix-turn-helix domain-containing protein [Bacteroidetes bacterium]|nr:helix-turn-helix domain-containing protein [Bacteroidota bacterium]MBU1371349.1 helix-turn-helix domain-containing protein [Bacteroidota bacterium]MBU1485836.1 helix-turn-helix domain-containing protein [Bacteroidota bacterium]MBU1761084.1 helix-turn-helix domain-containing protein [Bacteroidota bacterium]MBU2268149.1 helix-turn-helix domain-containing protein [Bacteroidota bacterium]
MASNIRVKRICQHCAKEFEARTTVTKYCSDKCAKRAYKARLKADKIEESNIQTQELKKVDLEPIKAKEFLTIPDVAKLLNCSLRTAYRIVNSGRIKSVNISERKTLVRRSDIDSLFDQAPVIPAPEPKPRIIKFKIEDAYNMSEIQSKFGISEKALFDLIKRNNIEKVQKGKYVFVRKAIIDKLLS